MDTPASLCGTRCQVCSAGLPDGPGYCHERYGFILLLCRTCQADWPRVREWVKAKVAAED